MADRTCEKCGKKFSKPCLLRRHQARKTPCVSEPGPADPQKTCLLCGRTFRHRSSLVGHMKTACPRVAVAVRKGDPDSSLWRVIRAQAEKIKSLSTKNEGQAAEIKALREAAARRKPPRPPGKTPAVNVFGRENVLAIPGLGHALAIILLRRGGQHENLFVPQMIVQVAFLIFANPEHPENITCFTAGGCGSSVLVYGERGWDLRSKEWALSSILVKAVGVLSGFAPLAKPEKPDDFDAIGDEGRSMCQDSITRVQKFRSSQAAQYLTGKSGGLRAVLHKATILTEQIWGVLPSQGSS